MEEDESMDSDHNVKVDNDIKNDTVMDLSEGAHDDGSAKAVMKNRFALLEDAEELDQSYHRFQFKRPADPFRFKENGTDENQDISSKMQNMRHHYRYENASTLSNHPWGTIDPLIPPTNTSGNHAHHIGPPSGYVHAGTCEHCGARFCYEERIKDNPKRARPKEYFMAVFGLGVKSTECLWLLTLRQVAFPPFVAIREITDSYDNYMFTMLGSMSPASWLGSDTRIVAATMVGICHVRFGGFTITYVAVSSPFGGLLDIESLGVDGQPVLPDLGIRIHHRRKVQDGRGLIHSPGLVGGNVVYVPEFVPEPDPADYPADRGDKGDDEDESSDDDEDGDEEEDEYLALADSTAVALPAVEHAPSAEETEPFETDESAATPPPHPAYRKMALKRTTRATTTTTTTTFVMDAQLEALIEQGAAKALAARDADKNMNGDDIHVSGTGIVELTQWFEKMETVFRIRNCSVKNQIKFSTCTLLGSALTWWNSYVITIGPDVAYVMTLVDLKKKITDKSVVASRPKTMQEAIEMENELMDKRNNTWAKRQAENKRKFDDTSRNNQSQQQQQNKRQNTSRAYTVGSGGNTTALAKVYAVGRAGINPDSNVVTDYYYDVELADGRIIGLNSILRGYTLNFLNHTLNIDLMHVELGSFDAIIGNETRLNIISCTKTQKYMLKGCHVFLAHITTKETEDKSEKKRLENVPIVQNFPKVFLEDLPGLPLTRQVEFQTDLIPGVAPVARAPYQLAPFEKKELSDQLKELSKKGFIRPSSSPWGALVLFVKKKDRSF
nr:hypothetical protein [Tanacetum cinerariifolium]